ncbi:hypothetical protein Bca101_074859 [Brassica carinata]
MESEAGSSVARRRRRLSVVALSFVSLPLHVTLLLHEFLVGLGFLCSFAVTMCWRCCRCCHFIIWLLLSPSPSLLTALVPDLCHKTSTFSICYSQIPDLKLLGRVFPSSSPTTLNFLPSGKIDANWFSCPCGSRTSPPGSLFVRSMRLNGSKYYYQTIQTKFLLFDDPRTNPCSLQTPFEATHTDDCSTFLSLSDHNDQWLDFGSVKSPGLQHGNAGVGCLCLESTPVHSEVCVKPISLSVGIKVRLGPVDATILILMRVEVLDGAATSYAIVTNRSLFEDFEVRFNRITSGNFDIFHNSLSNFYKFVSLSSFSIVLYVWGLVFCLAHRGLYDVASTRVIV